ncbi:hypothetical protein B0H66DRAFT_219797 [Apodospora peruviana]|uniref:Secreted protein n=1 Tax=Apodospora peruviana TaxID=516989 RepID=A0AAE0I5F3_9PEZI|nr:hypothetical protein B0H66DRAFT_219797 [Apodospora peruviana]
MKFFTAAAILLPASAALANPLVAVRQPPPRAKFTGGFSTSGNGCAGASVAFDATNEIATVSLPNYFVNLPNRPATSCAVTLLVRFPAGQCTSGTAVGHVSGHVNLPVGVTGTFTSRDYAVSPDGNVSQISPNGQWTGPTDTDYTLDDQVSYTYNRPDANNNVVSFTLQGQLQLQPTNGPTGSLSNNQFVFDIQTQIPC